MPSRTAHRKHAHAVRKQTRQPFDYVVYFFMIATPLFELPQVTEIYRHHSAQNVSLTTWSFFCVDNLVWMTYAFRKKDWPVFFGSAFFEVMEVAIVIGIFMYR